MPEKILILEDDQVMASEVTLFLTGRGYECKTISDGARFFSEDLQQYDLFLLDINVPTYDGFRVAAKIREVNADTPILMLTAYSTVADKVKAFDRGADDYLVKPFHFEELLVRIRALLRRRQLQDQPANTIHKVGDLVVDTAEKTVSRAGKPILLTNKEYRLLELLLFSKGRTVSKQEIALKVWDINFETSNNTIEVYINFLRSKIDKGFGNKLIHTRHGYGYYLKIKPE